MNNKGFTLTELIVTMALVTLISLISFPTITNLQRSSKQQIYESYEKVLINGAKLYVDKYDRDLFSKNNQSEQCVSINYSDLISENLIKEIKNKNEKIDSDNTYINAKKKNYNVTYEASFQLKENEVITYKSIKNTPRCSHINIGQ